MAICTVFAVIPMWCTEPEEPVVEEPQEEEIVVEAQPAPDVDAEPIGGTGLRPMSELEVRPPASAADAPAAATPEPEAPADTPTYDDGAGPDPRLYGSAVGPDWTPPPMPEDPAPMPELRTSGTGSFAPENAYEPTAPTTRAEPLPESPAEPDVSEVAIYDPSSAATPPAPEPERPRYNVGPRIPASPPATVTGPSMPEDDAHPTNPRLREVSYVIDTRGPAIFASAEEFATPSAAYEAEGIEQRKRRNYRREQREIERRERRERRR